MNYEDKENNIEDIEEKTDSIEPEIEDSDHIKKNEKKEYDTASVDVRKIDSILDSFLSNRQAEIEKEKRRREKIARQKRIRRIMKLAGTMAVILFIALFVFLNPMTRKALKEYKKATTPKEQYEIKYIYSSDTEIFPVGDSIGMYDSNNLKLFKVDGSEIFNIPFTLGDWEVASSDDRIYLLDKTEKLLYFIDKKGNFIAKSELSNTPETVYAGKKGNIAIMYRSDAGVEGVVLFTKDGEQLEDLNYPKNTLSFAQINKNNEISVHGMYRIDPKLSNYLYKYNSRGKLIFSTAFEGVIFIRQYEDDNVVALVDVNSIIFYDKSSNTVKNRIDSIIPVKFVEYDENSKLIYVFDKRNKLRIINMNAEVVEERHYQSDYKAMTLHKGKVVFFGDNYIRVDNREIQISNDIQDYFVLDNYLGIVTKEEIILTNKVE